MTDEARILLLELQNEELLAKLEHEEAAHQKASSRATAAERQNKALRKKIAYAEGEINIIEQCWNCPDLGNSTICAKCSNNAVFIESEGKKEWRRYPMEQRR